MINKKSQQGATLVIVLLVMLLIIIIGTLAVRQSLVSLNIATNGQAQQLMFENSDSAVFTLQDADNLSQELATNGMFGYIRTANNKGKELVFCYKGTQPGFFSLANASVMQWKEGQVAPDGTELGSGGYCSVNSANNYTSGRRAVMTQVSIQFVSLSSGTTPFAGTALGTDAETAKVITPEKAIVHTISIMPTLSSASNTDINTCLSTKMSNPSVPTGVTATAGASQSVSQCIAALNVPFETHVTEYNLTQTLSSS